MALAIQTRFVDSVSAKLPWLPRHFILPLAAALVLVPALTVLAFSYGPMVSVQPESGSLSGGASSVADASASGGQSLRFGTASGLLTCDRNATTATFGTQLAAATAGQTICLAAGDYGDWAGTSKDVTIGAQPGVDARIAFDFRDGDANFTLDGLKIKYGTFLDYSNGAGGPRDITIKNSEFLATVFFDGIYNSNILLDNNTHININFAGPNNAVTCADYAGALQFSYGHASMTSGVTIQNSLFKGGNKDGIQTSIGVNVLNNEFDDIGEHGAVCGDYADTPHTDAIQLLGAHGSVVRGNYFHNVVTGIVAYDGLSNALIENNVIETVSRPEGIEINSDVNSIVRHNVVVFKNGCGNGSNQCGYIYLGAKSGDPAGVGTVIEDNIATGISINNGSTASVNRNNMFPSGASGQNFNGTPVFAGGATPTTHAGFILTPGSPGFTGATNSSSVGIYSR